MRDTASWRAGRESKATSSSDTHIRRVSLKPAPNPEHDDAEPRFSGEERPTRLSHDAISIVPAARASTSPAAERRSDSRAPFIADLEFGEDAQFFTGLSLDISEGGLFVATYTEIPIGTRLVLCFELPDGTEVEARGEVKWRRTQAADGERPGIGIAFTDLPAPARDRIAELCERRPPLYFDM